MTRRLIPLVAVLLLVLGLASVPHGAVLAVPRCGTDHTVCTPTPSPTPQATPTPTAQSGVPMAAPTIVQSNSGTTSAAFPSAVTAGDLLIVIATLSSTAPTDTLGTTYTGFQRNAGANTVAAWYGYAPTSGANTVTSSGANPIVVMEISAAATARPIDVVSSAQINATSGTVTTEATAVATDLVIAAGYDSTNAALAAPSGYTTVQSTGGVNVAQKSVVATGTQSATWTFAGASGNNGAVFAIRSAASSPWVTEYRFPVAGLWSGTDAISPDAGWATSGTASTGENGGESTTGNPADALFSRIHGVKSAGPTTLILQTPAAATFASVLGVPSNATITAITVALDWECSTYTTGGVSSWLAKLTYGANSNSSTATSVAATSAWATLTTQNISGISGVTGASAFQLQILPSLRTGNSLSADVLVLWDNVKITVTYSLPAPNGSAIIVTRQSRMRANLW